MKTLATIIGTITPVTAFAATTQHIDNSGIFSWIFLGFCAVIVLMQVMPALLMMLGMAKGLKEVMTHEPSTVRR
jgi:nucleoside phosphorylase